MRAPLSARRSRLRSAAVAASIVVALAVSACSSGSGAGQSSSSAAPPATTTSAAGQNTAEASSSASATAGGPAGSGSSVPGPSSGSTGTDARSLLPEKFKASGVIKVGSTFGYPPNQFMDTDGKTPIGISVDLADAVGKVLGVKFEFVSVTFDSLIAGLSANRYDTVIGSVAITPDRIKQFDMVNYQNAGAGIVVQGGNPSHIQGVEDLCGKKVAMLTGTHFIEQLTALSSKECEAKGKPKMQLDVYQQSADVFQAVAAKRADANYASYDVARYAAEKSDGTMTFVDKLYPDAGYGALFTKENSALAKAFAAAMNEIIADGSYKQALDRWGAGAEAVTKSEVQTG